MSAAGASGHQPKNNTLPRPTLTNLPQELRLLIWKQVFKETIVRVKMLPHTLTNDSTVYTLLPHASPSPHPLCYVNRQTYQEAIDLFYEEATFEIDIRVLPLLSSHTLAAKVRNLSITAFAYWCYFDRACSDKKRKPASSTTIYDIPLPNLKHLRLDWSLEHHGALGASGLVAHWERKQAQSLVHLSNARRAFDVEIHIEMQDYTRSKPSRLTPLTLFTATYTPAGLVFNYKHGQKRMEACETVIRSALGFDGRAV
ncbi:hypothetical protein LTR70_003911 [Exophiala xenobiotica]|uniref:Uncharacterized protein n=1 Tax=Lithohypha guttulata TaxID=1690604 RepID=A0ABR0KET0_9EURO|nr:hypothetical protein LTR24_003399 [Lithohypha guttulata]KAK5322230.1 hypothetical protein LTR70_003911 [Exophiala xenobiotica]